MLIASTAGAGIPCMCIIVKLHLGCTKFNNLIPTMEKMLAQYPLFHSCFHEQYKATKELAFYICIPLPPFDDIIWFHLIAVAEHVPALAVAGGSVTKAAASEVQRSEPELQQEQKPLRRAHSM